MQQQLEPQESKVMALCEKCQCEIYEGEMVYTHYGLIFCSQDCLLESLDIIWLPVEEAV